MGGILFKIKYNTKQLNIHKNFNSSLFTEIFSLVIVSLTTIDKLT